MTRAVRSCQGCRFVDVSRRRVEHPDGEFDDGIRRKVMMYHWLRFVWQGATKVLRVLQERAAGWGFAC